jgi:hypothetical protein
LKRQPLERCSRVQAKLGRGSRVEETNVGAAHVLKRQTTRVQWPPPLNIRAQSARCHNRVTTEGNKGHAFKQSGGCGGELEIIDQRSLAIVFKTQTWGRGPRIGADGGASLTCGKQAGFSPHLGEPGTAPAIHSRQRWGLILFIKSSNATATGSWAV